MTSKMTRNDPEMSFDEFKGSFFKGEKTDFNFQFCLNSHFVNINFI